MASDTILSNLFEIAQSEVDEILYFNDFVAEMRNNFKELTNDEYDSALLAINEQIKSGNKLMSTSAGKVTISNSIISKAIKTVEYEKQQKEIYKINREENRVSIEEVVITTAVLSQMIANYDNLSQDEKSELISNLDKVDITEMGDVLGKIGEDYEEIAKNTKKPEDKQNALFAEELTGVLKSLFDEYNAGNIEEVKAILKKHPSLTDGIEDVNKLDKNQLREVLEKSKIVIKEIQESFFESFSLSNKGELSSEEIKKAIELKEKIEGWKTQFPEEYKIALEKYNKKNQENFKNNSGTQSEDKINNAEKNNDENSEKGDERKEKSKESAKSKATQSDDKQKNAENIDEKKPKSEKNLQFEPPKNFYEVVESYKKGSPIINFQDQDGEGKTNQIEEIPSAPLKVGFKSEEIREAVTQYKEYFERASEDDLQFLSEQTDVELAEILKSEFQELEVDEEVGKLLKVMAEINYHGKIGEMLTNPQKREKFFSELEQVANMDFEKFQDSVEVSEIKDSEVAQLFERLSVELQVAPFEPAREGLESEFFNMPTDEADKSAVPSTEVDGIYIYNGVLMEVDKEFTQIATDAQERGEDLEKAILEYYEKQQQEKAEQERASEEKEEHVEPEIIVVDERGEQAQEQEVAMQDEFFRADEETGEEIQASDGQDKKVVVIKKGKEGTIQVFRPSSFLKVVKQSEITFDKVKDVQNELARIVEQERENGEKPGTSKGNGNQSSKDDSWEY